MPPEPSHISEADEAELAALADGRLDPVREQRLSERLDSDPALAAAFEQQQRGLAAITAAAADVSAPLSLRTRIEEMERAASTPRQRRRIPRLRIGLPALGLAAAAAAAVLVVLVGNRGPSVDGMLAAATRPPLAAATLDPSQPKLLREHVENVPFPNYEGALGWKAAGTRTDTIDGRATRTVGYTRGGRRVAYTIVAGEALAWPGDARATTRDGTELRSFSKDGRTVVTWRRGGRTCVLSATGVPLDTLLELAAWKGQGAVAF